jgi:hypothetical protein
VSGVYGFVVFRFFRQFLGGFASWVVFAGFRAVFRVLLKFAGFLFWAGMYST